jgi:hypothetical protein
MTNDELKELRAELRMLRVWANDNLPAKQGLVLIVRLEEIMDKIPTN